MIVFFYHKYPKNMCLWFIFSEKYKNSKRDRLGQRQKGRKKRVCDWISFKRAFSSFWTPITTSFRMISMSWLESVREDTAILSRESSAIISSTLRTLRGSMGGGDVEEGVMGPNIWLPLKERMISRLMLSIWPVFRAVSRFLSSLSSYLKIW